MDLFIIPQEESSDEMIERQKIEISHKAGIFGLASKTIAWFNDVHGRTGTQAFLIWLCLAFLKLNNCKPDEWKLSLSLIVRALFTDPTERHLNFLLDVWKTANFVEFCQQQRDHAPNDWFTSLWALQEGCLCRDMLVYNLKWEYLSLTGIFRSK